MIIFGQSSSDVFYYSCLNQVQKNINDNIWPKFIKYILLFVFESSSNKYTLRE